MDRRVLMGEKQPEDKRSAKAADDTELELEVTIADLEVDDGSLETITGGVGNKPAAEDNNNNPGNA